MPLETSGSLSADETRDLVQHISGLASAGLPLAGGMRALQEEVPPGALRAVVGELAERLELGEPLEAILASQGRRFPGHLRNLILAGVRSGRIEAVLGEFVSYSLVGASLRRRLWTALAYPMVLIAVFVGLFLALCLEIVTKFKAIFADFGMPLPMLTRSLIWLSDLMVSAGWTLFWGPLAGLILLAVAGRFLLDSPARSRLMLRLPLFGNLARWTALAEFLHYLGLLLECGLSLVAALPLAAEGAGEGQLVEACEAAVRDVREGRSLADSVCWWRVFPPGFVKVLRWAEGHQSMPETFHMMAEVFEARARSQASFIGTVCGVLAVALVLWGCAYIIMALFIPLILLIQRLV